MNTITKFAFTLIGTLVVTGCDPSPKASPSASPSPTPVAGASTGEKLREAAEKVEKNVVAAGEVAVEKGKELGVTAKDAFNDIAPAIEEGARGALDKIKEFGEEVKDQAEPLKTDAVTPTPEAAPVELPAVSATPASAPVAPQAP